MPVLTTEQWLLALIAALSIGMSKAGFGGISMIFILLMAHIMPARESTGTILPMLILADIFAVFTFRRYANGRLVLRMLPPALVGIVCGWLLIPVIPAESFGRVIGWVTLGLLLLMLAQKLRPQWVSLAAESRGIAWPFGWLAGTTTMIANAAGPVMTIYLLACRLPKLEFVGTAAWFFFVVNVIKVPFSISLGLINPKSLMLNLWLAPAVVAGLFLGRWVLGKINQNFFEWMMLAFSLLGALRLILMG